MSPKVSTTAALSVIFAAFIGAVLLINTPLLSRARIDLTDDALYSLSNGSRQIVDTLDIPVKLRLFFSKRAATGFPSLQAFAQRVEDLLYEYAAQSGGTISVEVIDPEAFSEQEDEAVGFGLEGAGGQNGETIYFGLVGTNAIDGQEVIPFIAQQRENLLEYDITQLIGRLASERALPKIALVTDLPLQFGLGGPMAMAQGRAEPFVIYEQLAQAFDIAPLEAEFTSIPDGTDLLMLAHATKLGEAQHYAIDQFILSGGNAIIFVDPHSEVAATTQQRGQFGMPQPGGIDTTSDLAPLFAAWGVSYDPSLVILDLDQAQRVNLGSAGARGRQIVDYVAWISANPNNIDDNDIVTSELEVLSIAASGHFTLTEASPLSLTPLITSSSVAGVTNVSEVQGPPKPDQLIQTLLPTGETYVLAGRLTGDAASAFPDGAPGESAAGKHLAKSTTPINVILIADTDMLADNFWAQVQNILGQRLIVPTADNGRFVLNAAENMAGSDALISLRSRGTSARPFRVINQMRSRAERDFAAQQQILQNELAATETRLAQLQSEAPEGDAFISDEQLSEIDSFRTKLVETRKQLRGVQRSLNVDIDRLKAFITWMNILGVPALLLLAAGLYAGVKRRRAK
ncbi:MAG: Gldg family protein [Pseudomonadota bacterium]